jgi:hypothetical protein
MEDPGELTRLTRGKDLLAKVRQHMQERYAVSFGNNALVGEMTDNEVDDELWGVLDRIEELAA